MKILYTKAYESPLGKILLASDGEHLTGLWFEGQKYFASTIGNETRQDADLKLFPVVETWLDAYFSSKNPEIARLPLAPMGSEFRQSVWSALCEIPYGTTVTYGQIAQKVGCRSARAVGGAVGNNPISIIIPCHRVVGADGSLTGYAGGMERKIKLLTMEQVDVASFRVPKTGTAV